MARKEGEAMTSIVRNGELVPEATATVIVDVDLDAEVPCESNHLDGPPCEGAAVWGVTKMPCGCRLIARTVCDARRRWLGEGWWRNNACGAAINGSAWVATWRRL